MRENRGWVLVTPEAWTEEYIDLVQRYWEKVSDLPIIVIMETDLLVDTEGRVVVKHVAFETEPVVPPVLNPELVGDIQKGPIPITRKRKVTTA